YRYQINNFIPLFPIPYSLTSARSLLKLSTKLIIYNSPPGERSPKISLHILTIQNSSAKTKA
ncbi:hypothetical protein, partial [Hydrocoleum sp. CS-953]|uniref:hypothetical protein n=1 Tax=Hydrocoleum sp. CS-953 TaxID=1671698 RepID=UPI001AEFB313